MLDTFGWWVELLLIFIIVAIIFEAGNLLQLGEGIGKPSKKASRSRCTHGGGSNAA